MNALSNKSLDVRAKQRLCYQTCVVNSTLSVFGFARVNSIVGRIDALDSNLRKG